jgi:hypothetical protein
MLKATWMATLKSTLNDRWVWLTPPSGLNEQLQSGIKAEGLRRQRRANRRRDQQRTPS